MADWLPPKAPEANTPSVGATPEVLQAGHETRALQLTHAIVNVRAIRKWEPSGAERNAAPRRAAPLRPLLNGHYSIASGDLCFWERSQKQLQVMKRARSIL